LQWSLWRVPRAAPAREMYMDYSITVHTALRVAALFAQLPMLSGFSVQERATLTSDRDMAPLDGDLCVADVSVDPWTSPQATPVLCGEIAQALLELLEEHPEACELLRGHTFARTFH
jgi:hypothetical protein